MTTHVVDSSGVGDDASAATEVDAERRPGTRRTSEMIREDRLVAGLGVVALLALAGLGAVFIIVDDDQRSDLWFEVGKGLIQIIAVVLFGAALKLVIDRYQDKRAEQERARRERAAKEEQNRRFRQHKYDSLVAATNSLRKVPILIDANRSVKTWSAQMEDVIDAGLQLRTIKHQIYSSREVEDRPFRDAAALVYLFEVMYHYTDWVTRDFATNKSLVSPLQARAEEKGLCADEVSSRKAAVWQAIQDLPSVKDMQAIRDDSGRDACRADLDRRIEPLLGLADVKDVEDPPKEPDPSWLVYETAETLALELLTDATLSPPAGGSPAAAAVQ